MNKTDDQLGWFDIVTMPLHRTPPWLQNTDQVSAPPASVSGALILGPMMLFDAKEISRNAWRHLTDEQYAVHQQRRAIQAAKIAIRYGDEKTAQAFMHQLAPAPKTGKGH